MKQAYLNGSIIHLDKLARDQFQIIYEHGINGNLTCLCCGKQVKLYLGIQKSPHFYHRNDQDCEKKLSTEKEPTPYTLQNGFRLPKSRSITSTSPSAWQPCKEVRITTPFQKKAKKVISFQNNFLLDVSQWEAVSYTNGPLLVLAGAGSGKTRVLTAKTAYLITEKDINPNSIMLVTFTSKAAKEMKERLASFPELQQNQLRQIVSGTFHSLFYRIITYHDREKWQSAKLLKGDWQKELILKRIGMELNLDEKEFPFDQAIQQIGFWKNTLTIVDQVKPKDQWEERTAFLYKRYEEIKSEEGLFDFDDMLLECYTLLKENPSLLEKYQARFNYFLIDEFQDINRVQYEIIQLLVGKSNNICVVGDDDQSIYHFRGSDPAFILHFEQDYPNAKIVKLEQNYRSTHAIVSYANKVITKNEARHEKKMIAQKDNHLNPILFYPYDEEEEATMICVDINERIKQGEDPNHFAILFRTNSSSRAIFERMAQSSMPFVIDQASDSFYERFIVKTILAYFRLSINQDDIHALNYFLSAMFIKKTALNELKAISILKDCTMLQSLLEYERVKAFQRKKLTKIIPLFNQLKKMSPLLAIDMIEKEMGFQDFVKKRGNEGNAIERGSDDIRDLRVVARKFNTIPAFLAHVDHMIAMNNEIKEISRRETNGIHLSTIHRAKGLEYKHVYILGVIDGSLPHDFALDALRNGDNTPLEEERRLMYVAMTRAKDSLYLSIPQMRRGKKAGISRFIRG